MAFVELEDVTAAKLNAEVGMVVHKEVTQTTASDAAFSDDDDLLWDVVANAFYAMKLYVIYETSDVPDIKFGFAVPLNATLTWGGQGYDGASAHSNFGNEAASGPVVFGGSSPGVPRLARLIGYLTTADADGRLILRWAQSSNDAASTAVLAGSFGILRRLA